MLLLLPLPHFHRQQQEDEGDDGMEGGWVDHSNQL